VTSDEKRESGVGCRVPGVRGGTRGQGIGGEVQGVRCQVSGVRGLRKTAYRLLPTAYLSFDDD